MFDPSGLFKLPLNWVSLMVFFLALPSTYWASGSRDLMWVKTLFSSSEAETSSVHKTPKWGILISALFCLIFLNNMFGLLPWVFTGTSHIVITLSLGLPIWLAWFSFKLKTNINGVLALMTPTGVSMVLALFLALVETLSLLIRPLTLSIRLAANMIAGHLILSLVMTFVLKMFSLTFTVALILSSLLLVLEIAVSLIQSYVFATLVILYLE